MSDLISILMPACGAQDFIVEAVSSVVRQTYKNWELIIIADDDYDYASLLMQHGIDDERIRFASTQRFKSGPNHARNRGLRLARGPWIAPLDADDVYYPARLKRLMGVGQNTGLALDNINIIGDDLPANANPVLNFASMENFCFAQFKQSLVPLLFLFHREHISQGWDEDIKCGADTLFNLRALEHAGKAAFIPEPLHEYRVHNASMCHSPGAEQLFDDAYEHTLHRLQTDGLGFRSVEFQHQVIDFILEKKQINLAFNQAVAQGFAGNYQQFVALSV